MRLSSMADYAVVAWWPPRAAGGEKANAGHIALKTGLPRPPCKAGEPPGGAGLLKSTRGAGGGLRLARRRRRSAWPTLRRWKARSR
jgi:DNA-binding IscR family transcriptional regulator